jgi:hypothetical protein
MPPDILSQIFQEIIKQDDQAAYAGIYEAIEPSLSLQHGYWVEFYFNMNLDLTTHTEDTLSRIPKHKIAILAIRNVGIRFE